MNGEYMIYLPVYLHWLSTLCTPWKNLPLRGEENC